MPEERVMLHFIGLDGRSFEKNSVSFIRGHRISMWDTYMYM
jgi:hypothetical protein